MNNNVKPRHYIAALGWTKASPSDQIGARMIRIACLATPPQVPRHEDSLSDLVSMVYTKGPIYLLYLIGLHRAGVKMVEPDEVYLDSRFSLTYLSSIIQSVCIIQVTSSVIGR